MPGVTKYNLVDDAHDLRIPMHNDEVFKHGVCFEAKVRTLCYGYFPVDRNNLKLYYQYVSNTEVRAIHVTVTVTTTTTCFHVMLMCLHLIIHVCPFYLTSFSESCLRNPSEPMNAEIIYFHFYYMLKSQRQWRAILWQILHFCLLN